MDEKDFAELIGSVREAGQIMRGEKRPARITRFTAPDVKQIRNNLNLSQDAFANLIGVSLRTYQNWEQGTRTPRGAALTLLRMAQYEPQAFIRVLHRQDDDEQRAMAG